MARGVGEPERETQARLARLFVERLGYEHLGDWSDRQGAEGLGNRNIEPQYLRNFLFGRYAPEVVDRAIAEFERVAGDQSRSLYDVNAATYDLLRYGVRPNMGPGEGRPTVWLIDWANPEANHFAMAEEVTVRGRNTKRPDIVLYVNGIALGVIELKRSLISVSEGIRQNLDNQRPEFIRNFFSTVQFLFAGNDTEGLRYGVIETPEKYWLTWKEPDGEFNPLDRSVLQMCSKSRLLELVHDFIVFDSGVKKSCRHNQFFGVKAAQDRVRRREGGIIWHTQGSGKSLTMVWLAKWIRENAVRGGKKDARVVIITDRTELDEQIEKVFLGVNEKIRRAKDGGELVSLLNDTTPWLMCSLIHKFAGKEEADVAAFVADLKQSLPKGFLAKGDLYVFVDECHRTQSGKLHEAMKAILPDAMFIGFTGTPLLRADKETTLETFGTFIHTYKFNEAVADGVVLDLRYEARDIDQRITSPEKIDQWFEAKTRGLNDLAKAQLKQRWGTLRRVLSSQSRLDEIVSDILMDMGTKDRLKSGRGNAILVSDSIYQACKLYELFEKTELAGKCAIVTSYKPSPNDMKGETTGEGLTEKLRQYEIYNRMLGDKSPEAFEKEAKEKFIKTPGQMKLLIVVDKLLTGFDAPSATYLYIDKSMRDHGLFQAICRVNRLDGDDKEYGYIIDYKDLFRSLETAITDYTSGALDSYEKEDVEGLLTDRIEQARERLEDALDAVRALCEQVDAARDTEAYLRYFCGTDRADADALKEAEPRRLALYRLVAALLRAYANIADELETAGFDEAAAMALSREVDHFEKVRSEVKLASGDYVDLKVYEPAMRHLIDAYIRADDSRKISAFDDLTLVQMIVERGAGAIDALPEDIRRNERAAAETIENNVRRLIIDETPANPEYYERMSELLDALIERRRRDALDYEAYLAQVVELARRVSGGPAPVDYPATVASNSLRALYDNLGRDETLALNLDREIRRVLEHGFRENPIKARAVRGAIRRVIPDEDAGDRLFDIVKAQSEY